MLIGAHAFEGCTSLTAAAVCLKASSGDALFMGCTSLKNAEVHGTLTDSMFKDCTSLQYAACYRTNAIPDSCFRGCTALANVSFADGVIASIG